MVKFFPNINYVTLISDGNNFFIFFCITNTGNKFIKIGKYFMPQPGDLRLPAAADAATARQAIGETLARLP